MAENELSEIDQMMKRLDEDPLGLTQDDLVLIVQMQRAARARADAGLKAARDPATKIDLKALGLVKAKPAIDRRI